MSWLGRLFGRSDPKQLPAGRMDAGTTTGRQMMDGWGNVITGLKTARDKRRGTFHSFHPLTDLEVRELWLGDVMVRKLIELLPKEVMRRGYQLNISTDGDDAEGAQEAKEMSEAVMSSAESLGYNQQIIEALKFKRAYGGAALFPVLEGALGDLSTPLNMDRITKVNAFHLFEPREMYPIAWYNDLNDPKFGRPSVYRFVPIVAGGMPAKQLMVEIHESRLIIFQGIKVSRLHQAGNRIGWGDNVVTAPNEVIRDFGLTWGAVAALMQDFAQAVLKIDGLGNLIATDQDKIARERIAQIDLIRSFMRMVVIDSKDEFDRKQTPMGGLPEILREFWTLLASSFDMPVTLIAGISPAGLNATGESDRAFWFDRVGGEQTAIEPQVEQGLELLMRSTQGPTDGEVPETWGIAWNPLYAPTDKEVAETRWLVAQTVDKMVTDQVITPEEAAHSLYGGDTFSMEIKLDKAAREAMAKLDPAATGMPGAPQPPMIGPDGQPIPQPPGPPVQPTTAFQTGGSDPAAGKREVAPLPANATSSALGRRVQVVSHERTVKPRGSNGAG